MICTDEKIELVDKKGVVRIRLGIDSGDRPYLSLNGDDGRERLILGVDSNGNGSLGFRTATGQPTLSLGMSSESGTGMMILDVQDDNCLTFKVAEGRFKMKLKSREGVFVWPEEGGSADRSGS